MAAILRSSWGHSPASGIDRWSRDAAPPAAAAEVTEPAAAVARAVEGPLPACGAASGRGSCGEAGRGVGRGRTGIQGRVLLGPAAEVGVARPGVGEVRGRARGPTRSRAGLGWPEEGYLGGKRPDSTATYRTPRQHIWTNLLSPGWPRGHCQTETTESRHGRRQQRRGRPLAPRSDRPKLACGGFTARKGGQEWVSDVNPRCAHPGKGRRRHIQEGGPGAHL
jgi:hypothetical protein